MSQITLLVDTGATVSTILQTDAVRLGINFSKLRLIPGGTIGISGKEDVYEIDDVIFAFEDASKPKKLIYQKLKKMNVLKPKEPIDESLTFSIMGVDLLSRFHFTYSPPDHSLDLL